MQFNPQMFERPHGLPSSFRLNRGAPNFVPGGTKFGSGLLPGLPRAYAARHAASGLSATLRRLRIRPTRHCLVVSVARQELWLCRVPPNPHCLACLPYLEILGRFPISTSAWGIGQVENSQQTPLGLHRIARKIGGGHLPGTAFRGRQAVGYVWNGAPGVTIVHRILWLEGLEPGFNRGGAVDTFRRYIYIHGFNDESTLGRPCSHGCIHMAAADLIPLYDFLSAGTLVWIAAR